MSPTEPFWASGLAFECTRCSACCRHDPGYVFLSQKDLDALCDHFHLSEALFRERYCRVVDFGITKRLSLLEKKNFDCIFWTEGCTVYEARPLQCRAFPFWMHQLESPESWAEAGESCPGINQGTVHGRAVIERWLKRRLDEPVLEE